MRSAQVYVPVHHLDRYSLYIDVDILTSTATDTETKEVRLRLHNMRGMCPDVEG